MADASMQLRALGVRLKAAGARDIKLEMTRGLRLGAAPLIPIVRRAAIDQLPKAGGLNEQVASQKISVSVTTGAKTAGVRMKTTAKDTKQTDSGYVKHPVFGKWRKDVPPQQIPAAVGWWSKTLERSAPTVQPALQAVLESIAMKVRGL